MAVGATSGDVLLLVEQGAAFQTLHSDVNPETDDDDEGEGEKNPVPQFGNFPSVGER